MRRIANGGNIGANVTKVALAICRQAGNAPTPEGMSINNIFSDTSEDEVIHETKSTEHAPQNIENDEGDININTPHQTYFYDKDDCIESDFDKETDINKSQKYSKMMYKILRDKDFGDRYLSFYFPDKYEYKSMLCKNPSPNLQFEPSFTIKRRVKRDREILRIYNNTEIEPRSMTDLFTNINEILKQSNNKNTHKQIINDGALEQDGFIIINEKRKNELKNKNDLNNIDMSTRNINKNEKDLKEKRQGKPCNYCNNLFFKNTSLNMKPTLERVLTRDIDQMSVIGDVKNQIWGSTKALYDTGASIDAIDAKFARKYFSDKIRTKGGMTVHTANGQISLKEYIETELLINKYFIVTRLYLIPNLGQNVIIGRNTLHHCGFRLIQLDKEGNIIFPVYKHDCDLSNDFLDENDPWWDRLDFEEPSQQLFRAINKDRLLSDYSEVESHEKITKTNIADTSKIFQSNMKDLLMKNQAAYAKTETDVGTIDYTVRAKLKKGAKPFAIHKPYNLHPKLESECKRVCDLLCKAGIIEKIVHAGEWCSGITFAQKATGGVRPCMDARQINMRIESVEANMPTINELLDRFSGKSVFSTIDLKSGYFHLKLDKKTSEMCTFKTTFGIYRWKRLPFGLKIAPMIFQSVMQNIVFAGLPFVMVYLDDICIMSKNHEEHVQHLKKVFERIQKHGLKLRLDKCHWGFDELEYLGHTISGKSRKPSPKYVKKVLKCVRPHSKKELQSYLGLVNWLCSYLPGHSAHTKILYELLHKKAKFQWKDEHQAAFDAIQKSIDSIEQLHMPDLNKEFFIECDASKDCLGAVLMQKDANGKFVPIQWLSKTFSKSQRNWDIGAKECFAVIHACETWRKYLWKKFTVFTDHKNLELLFNYAKNFAGNKMWRWALRLQELDFVVVARPGKEQIISDYLSRYIDPNKPKSNTPKTVIYTDKDGVETHRESDVNMLLKIDKEVARRAKIYAQSAYTDKGYVLPNISNYLANFSKTNTYDENVFPMIGEPFDSHKTITENDILPCKNQGIFNPRNTFMHNIYKKHNSWLEPNTNKYNWVKQLYKIEKQIYPQQKSMYSLLPVLTRSMTRAKKVRKPIETNIQRNTNSDFASEVTSDSDDDEIIPPKLIEDIWVKSDFTSLDRNDLQSAPFLVPLYILKEEQIADPILYNLRWYATDHDDKWLKELPTFITKALGMNKNKLNLKDDILYFDDRIYIPASVRSNLMTYVHSAIGHMKFTKMQETMYDKYYWPYMNKDIKAFLSSCKKCYRLSHNVKNQMPMKLFPATRVFETLHIDIVGPFEPTESGNRYILTMCDRLSRYIEMAPIHSMKASVVARAILNTWIANFGIPQNILSDQGTNFESAIFQQLCKDLKIRKMRTTAYRPQTNGLIERKHREIKKFLRAIALENGLHFTRYNKTDVDVVDPWDEYLNIIKFRLNSLRCPATGFTPFQMVLGFQPTLPEDFTWSLNPQNKEVKMEKYQDYIRWLSNVKSKILRLALEQQQLYDNQRKKYFDNRRVHQTYNFNIGDIVRFRIWTAAKLEPQYSTEYKIIGFKDENKLVAKIQDQNTKHTVVANVNNLIPANPDVHSKRNKQRKKGAKGRKQKPDHKHKRVNKRVRFNTKPQIINKQGYPRGIPVSKTEIEEDLALNNNNRFEKESRFKGNTKPVDINKYL